jgi:CheY-like chemotaxis protein
MTYKGNGGHGRTIFLIGEDDETRTMMGRNFSSYGYRVIAALDGEDALDRVEGGGTDADLILVDLVRKSAQDALDLGRRIREHFQNNGHTPLVVTPEKYGKDVEGTEVNVEGNDWVFYLGEEPGQLRNLLARLLP